ncbi:MAG: AtpZ/AtpI family protein [Patescibacteria group bacterium]
MDQDEKPGKLQALQSLGLVWEVIVAIALPTTLFALGGRWLDTRFHTSPLFILVGLIASLGIVYLLVSRKAKEIALKLKSKP